MPAPANIAALVVLAGVGIGLALWKLINSLSSEEVPHEERRRSPSPFRRRSSPPTTRRRSSSPETPPRRAVSPPRETPPVVLTPARRRRNRVRSSPGEIPNCRICRGSMQNSTITLNCGHTFHDACFTILRSTVVMRNPDATVLCPSCRDARSR